MVKSVKIKDDTHKRLLAQKVEWGMKTMSMTIDCLQAEHDVRRREDLAAQTTPSTTDDAGTKKYPNEKENTTRQE